MRFLVFLIILCSCSPKVIRLQVPAANQSKEFKTPTLILPEPTGLGMSEAATIFALYANSDEFYAYAKKEIHNLKGGNEKDVDRAILIYRSCLSGLEPVKISWYNYRGIYKNRVLGGWRRDHLVQNPHIEMNPIRRAGHWIHELTHACGFTHIENDIVRYPVIKESWPYQVGEKFEKFLWLKSVP